MKGSLYALGYAAVLGGTCALLLTGAKDLTEARRLANKRAEKVRHILEVLEVPYDAKSPPAKLLEVFDRSVREEKRGDLTVYVYAEADGARAVAAPFEGRGLWGPIRGILALEPDVKTIRGLTFYEQEETPGLGGEIGSDEFRTRFKGRSILSPSGEYAIRLVAPATETRAANEVHAISGATMTCDKVETMLNDLLERLAEEFAERGY